jgi:hypothetical protein
MLSTLYHERLTPADGSTNSSETFKPGSGRYGLDEIAIFALIAVAVFYIAVASSWFVY